MRHKGSAPHIPNSVHQLISYYRPESAVFYRLRDLAGTLHPPPTERAYRCLPSLDVPYVPAGRYQISYFDREGTEIEPVGGGPREIVVDAQYGTLKTPADLEEEEDSRLQRIERREMRNHREATLTHSLDKSTETIQRLSNTVADANERHSRALAELSDKYHAQIIEREQSMLRTIQSLLEVSQQQTRGASEAGAQQIKIIEHLVDRARSSHDWPGVVREVVVQLGALAQTFTPSREPTIRDGKPRLASSAETAPKLPPRADPPALPSGGSAASAAARLPATSESAPAASESAPKASESAPDDSHTSWIERLFGWSEPPPKPADPVAHAEPAPEPARTPAAPETAAKPADGSARSVPPGVDSSSAQTSAQTSAEDSQTALVPVDLGALLAQLVAQATPPQEPPPPSEWSRSWALKEAKRRVLALGEMGFLWTVTQPRRLLAFLKDLVAAIRPPPVADADDGLDGLRPAEALP